MKCDVGDLIECKYNNTLLMPCDTLEALAAAGLRRNYTVIMNKGDICLVVRIEEAKDHKFYDVLFKNKLYFVSVKYFSKICL